MRVGSAAVQQTILAFAFFLASTLPSTAQEVTDIHSFRYQDAYPVYGALIQGRDGYLYGTTIGARTPYGSAFRIAPSGIGGELYDFESTTVSRPYGGLTLATDGNFYGTTAFGGLANGGTLFKITPSGQLTVLHEFLGGDDGFQPLAPPFEVPDGNLYGVTYGALNRRCVNSACGSGAWDQRQPGVWLAPALPGGETWGAQAGDEAAAGTVSESLPAPLPVEPSSADFAKPQPGTIHIELRQAQVCIEGNADPGLVRGLLECLRA